MDLREALGLAGDGSAQRKALYQRFGITQNPFPSSGQTSDHPRSVGKADEVVQLRLRSFVSNSISQVIVVTGAQGVGKTNLLEYYRKNLPVAFADQPGYYVIKYLADPEPRFTGVILEIFNELGRPMWENIINSLAKEDSYEDLLREHVLSSELRHALVKIVDVKLAGQETDLLIKQLDEYLHGVRMLKIHQEALGVRFSLTTQEQKTTALRDIVSLARELGLIKGILLFMDELEKLGNLTFKNTLGYLSAIRALIDALPHSLFLVLAMTDTARSQYQKIFPSLAGRFGSPIQLTPLTNQDDAVALGRFYRENAREAALMELKSFDRGTSDIVTDERMRQIFEELEKKQSTGRGSVVQREFLDALHFEAQQTIGTMP